MATIYSLRNPIDKSLDNLRAIIAAGTIVVGQKYRITTGSSIGVMIVTGLTSNTLEEIAIREDTKARYVYTIGTTGADSGVLTTNPTGTNTGDETTSSIKSKLGISTLSGSNTGDETIDTLKTKASISGEFVDTADWGEPKGGYVFDGGDDAVTHINDNNFNFGTGDFSIEILYKSGNGTSGLLLTKGISSTTSTATSITGYGLYYDSSTFEYAFGVGDGTNAKDCNSGFQKSKNRIDHIIAIKNSTNLYMYINGKLYKTESHAITGSTSQPSRIFAIMARAGSSTVDAFNDGTIYLARLFNRALTQAEVISLYNNGLTGQNALPIADVGASNTELVTNGDAELDLPIFGGQYFLLSRVTHSQSTEQVYAGTYSIKVVGDGISSGVHYYGINRTNALTSAKAYGRRINLRCKVYIPSGQTYLDKVSVYVHGGINTSIEDKDTWVDVNLTSDVIPYGLADFSQIVNFAQYNSSGSPVTLINTDFYFIDDIQIKYVGCVAEYLPENAGRIGWIETMNGLHGSTSGSPICLNTEQRPLVYRDVKLEIANTATALTNIVPKGYRISTIRAIGTDSLSSVIIGTSSGGNQIVTSTTVTTTPSLLTLAGNVYSETTDTTLYAQHGTAGQTMDLIFVFEKINN